jgi:predicted phage terminase large subunit-like protein
MEKRQVFLKAQPSICDVTLDEIVAITPAGREEVFDLEIERTENFIADGVVSHNTRWSKRDLSGQVLKKQAALEEGEPGDRWEVIEFPAILDEGTPEERSLWPGFWTLEDLRSTRAVLPISKWKAQYQQNPTSEEGAIIKRENWRKWGSDRETCPADHLLGAWNSLDPPPCEFIMMSVDTALTKTQRSDYSAFTTWGVFKVDDPATGLPINNIVLLSAYKERMEFPELKKKVLQFYNEDMPDTLLIENKGSGISLIQELRAMDVAVEDFSFGRGGKYVSNDKVARANMVSDIFASGYVWAPERRFAEECIEECAEFPYGDHDDYVDSVVQALLRFRSGGLIRTANDMADDSDQPRQYRAKRFY